MFEFGYGILIAVLFDARVSLGRHAAAALVVAGLLSWLAVGLDPGLSIAPGLDFPSIRSRGFVWGIAAASIVAGLVLGAAGEQREQHPVSRFFARLGDASYSLYLVHLFVMRLVTTVFRHFEGMLGQAYGLIYLGALVSASVVAAFTSYRLLEKPAERAWRSRLQTLLHVRDEQAPGRQALAVQAGRSAGA